MKWLLTLFLTLPLWAQNNYAVDFNSAQTDKLYRVVSDYRIGDDVGFISVWFVCDVVSQFNVVFSSADTTATAVKIRVNVGQAANNQVYFVQDENDTDDVPYTTTKVAAGGWHHYVISSDGSSYSAWLDGQPESLSFLTGSNTGDWFADTGFRDNIAVGLLRHSGTFGPLDGRVDELSVHNVAATQSIVDAIYNGGTPRDVRNIGSVGVVSYWRFEEGTGQYALDSVGSDTLVFGDDATVETDDPAWIAAGLGWDSGSNRPLTPYKTSISTYRSY